MTEQIQSKADSLTQDILRIKAEVAVTTPISQEQINKLNGITAEITGIERLVQSTLFQFKRQRQTKDQLLGGWDRCNVIVSQLR